MENPSEPMPTSLNSVTLQRYLNGRFVSFDVDKLLPAFEPFHGGIVDPEGIVPLRFPGYENYELRLGGDAVARRVLLILDIRLPVLAPGFWFCIHCLMRDDFIALLSSATGSVLCANPETPLHAPRFSSMDHVNLATLMTCVESASEFVSLFTGPENGG